MDARMHTTARRNGFTLIEVLVALMLLAAVCGSLFIVMERCMAAVTNMIWERRAFEVARENMEAILCLSVVTESAEYGQSERYPEIAWETEVEMVVDPMNSSLSWLKATCSAEYEDTAGLIQTVSLAHLLTYVQEESAEDANEGDWYVYETMAKAAQDFGVDEDTIQEYLDNGMKTTDTEPGLVIRHNCQIYYDANGLPDATQQARQVTTEQDYEDLMERERTQQTPEETDILDDEQEQADGRRRRP